MNTKAIGDSAEALAAKYLQEQGCQVLKRNFRTRFGEIDLIILDGDYLVFVEVKKKSTDLFGAPGEMITPRKIQKIRRTAEMYLIENELAEALTRIDAVLIDDNRLDWVKSISG